MKTLAKHYPFTTTTGLLDNFSPPTQPFNPSGEWLNVYGIYSTGGKARRVGSLRLRRQVSADGKVVLTADHEMEQDWKRTSRSQTEIHCAADQLATPQEWHFEGGSSDPKGEAIAQTAFKGSVRVEKKSLQLDLSGMKRETPLSAPFTLNRCLFDAVQRLPRKAFDPIEFTMIDDLDQIKAKQRLSYRESYKTDAGDLHAFNHLGWGILPWTYWVNDQGRLLFATGGVQAYVLDAEKSQI